MLRPCTVLYYCAYIHMNMLSPPTTSSSELKRSGASVQPWRLTSSNSKSFHVSRHISDRLETHPVQPKATRWCVHALLKSPVTPALLQHHRPSRVRLASAKTRRRRADLGPTAFLLTMTGMDVRSSPASWFSFSSSCCVFARPSISDLFSCRVLRSFVFRSVPSFASFSLFLLTPRVAA